MKIYIPIILSILSIFSACDSEAGWQNLEVIETVKIDPVIDWTAVADSCTFVLVEQFMNKEKGTFWKSPKNVSIIFIGNKLMLWMLLYMLINGLRIRIPNWPILMRIISGFGLKIRLIIIIMIKMMRLDF